MFLWPVKLPGPDGKENEWHRSAREAAEKASTAWLRIKANMPLGAYDLFEARGDLPDPEWPALPFREILRIGFKDRHVDRLDHPLVNRLQGQA